MRKQMLEGERSACRPLGCNCGVDRGLRRRANYLKKAFRLYNDVSMGQAAGQAP